MLALTRRIGEEIVIGDPRNPLGIIRVVEIHGDKVRLSFNFPKETPINRKEVAELKAQGLNAASGTHPTGSNPPASSASSSCASPVKSRNQTPSANPAHAASGSTNHSASPAPNTGDLPTS